MINQLSFYEIKGNAHVEKIKKQILRLMVTKGDLEITDRILGEILSLIGQEPKVSETIMQSLTAYAIVSYTRCFNSSYSFPLSPNFYDDSTISQDTNTTRSDEKEISEKMFHFLLMNYRNKHIAHSDDFLKSGVVGGCKVGNDFGVAPLIASRVPIEDIVFYNSMGRLNHKALVYIEEKLKLTQNILLELLKAGTAMITNEEAKLIPIPLEVDALKMWGLKES